MEVIKFYISIVFCIGYFSVEETLADDSDTCSTILGHYFNFRDVHKTARDCLLYAFDNLTKSTFDGDTNTCGKRYYAYLYQSIRNKYSMKNARMYCKDNFLSDLEQCLIHLSALGLEHKRGISSIHRAYTVLLKSQLVDDVYSYKYYKYLIRRAKLKDDTKDPNQWCNDGYYRHKYTIEMRVRNPEDSSGNIDVEETSDEETHNNNIEMPDCHHANSSGNIDVEETSDEETHNNNSVIALLNNRISYTPRKSTREKYESCLNDLQTYFQFSNVIKSPQDCLEHAYKHLRMLLFDSDDNIYGKRYHAYLYLSVVHNKTPLKNPRKYCDKYFPSVNEECISDLNELGFYRPRGILCFKHAYTCLLDSQLNKDAYSYKYYEYLIETAILTDGTKDPNQWCHDGDYSINYKIDMRYRRST